MALTNKKYEDFYKTTGTDADKISSKNLDMIEKTFEAGALHGFHDIIDDPFLGPLVYMIQQMQDELDYLRTEISNNKDKTGISNSQASAITANTAKTGITTQQASTITANDKAVNNNASEITKNKNTISNLTPEIVAAIKVGSYPPLPPFALKGTTQSHGSEMVYDKLQGKYFLNIYYMEDSSKGGGKRIIRTGQIELK